MRLLKVKEAAEQLNMSESFLYQHIREIHTKKKNSGIYKLGKNWRIDLDKFLREGIN